MTWVLAIFLVLSFICNILLAGTLHVAMMDRMKLKRDLKMYQEAFGRALKDTSTYQYVKETLDAVARHERKCKDEKEKETLPVRDQLP